MKRIASKFRTPLRHRESYQFNPAPLLPFEKDDANSSAYDAPKFVARMGILLMFIALFLLILYDILEASP